MLLANRYGKQGEPTRRSRGKRKGASGRPSRLAAGAGPDWGVGRPTSRGALGTDHFDRTTTNITA
jgi:hypothetical protein